jgi:hypothetical protein
MAKASRLAPEQLRALGRVAKIPGVERFYLAGASAIAWHLGHRRSLDLDLFSRTARVSLSGIRDRTRGVRGMSVLDTTDVVLKLDVDAVPVDLVKYPYPLLEDPIEGPNGFPVAALRDLAAMKLSAIARRGIKRDFWDLYEIARAGISLREAAAAYRQRFGRSDADLYHVQRALTWFEDAEKDPRVPVGLTPAKWKRIKAFFVEQAPQLLEKD